MYLTQPTYFWRYITITIDILHHTVVNCVMSMCISFVTCRRKLDRPVLPSIYIFYTSFIWHNYPADFNVIVYQTQTNKKYRQRKVSIVFFMQVLSARFCIFNMLIYAVDLLNFENTFLRFFKNNARLMVYLSMSSHNLYLYFILDQVLTVNFFQLLTLIIETIQTKSADTIFLSIIRIPFEFEI